MLVPSISPVEISPPSSSAISGSGSTIPSQGNVTIRLPAEPQPRQNRPLDVKSAAGLVNNYNVSLRFKTDDVSGVRVIEVVNRDSGDVVFQIPSERIVDFLRYLKENNGDKGNFVSLSL